MWNWTASSREKWGSPTVCRENVIVYHPVHASANASSFLFPFPSSSLFYFSILPLETRACSFITVLGNLLSSSRETSGRIYTRKIHYTVMGTTKRKLCVVSWIYLKEKKKKDSIKFDLECLVIIFMQDRKRNKHNTRGAFCPANRKIEKGIKARWL